MALSNEVKRVRYAGSGTSYAITFIFYGSDEVTIIRTDASGNETTLTETTDYSVSGGSGATGTLTTVTSYSDGFITILHNHGLTQETDYTETGNFSVETLEQDLDKATLKIQEESEKSDRAISVEKSTDMTSFTNTVKVAAGKLIGFNAAGDGLITYEDADQGDADLSDLFNAGYSKIIYPNAVYIKTTGTNEARLITGEGTPEGSISALVGSVYFRTDGGAGTTLYLKESGSGNTGWVILTNTPVPRDISRGLIVSKATVSTIDIDADEIILHTTSSPPDVFKATSVNLTVDITASGANGLDTGSEAASTNYYLWVIYNGTTVAGLISASKTAPTMPSGYTFKALTGEFFNDSGSDIDYVNEWNGNYFENGESSESNIGVVVFGALTDIVTIDLGTERRRYIIRVFGYSCCW